MESLKKKFEGNRCIILIPLYAAFYLPWFVWLETHTRTPYFIIHMAADDLIPFCEYFIIFYFFWFVYMIFSVAYCVFTDQQVFYKSFGFMTTGMTLFLIISTLFPNGHNLRPETFANDNIFTQMVAFIYKADTPMNIFPSIHVYNAIAAHLSIVFNKTLKDKKWLKALSLFACIGICLSTLFLKQHSLYDVIGAIVLSIVMYPVFFREEYKAFLIHKRESREERRVY